MTTRSGDDCVLRRCPRANHDLAVGGTALAPVDEAVHRHDQVEHLQERLHVERRTREQHEVDRSC